MRACSHIALPLLALAASPALAGDMTTVDVHLSSFAFAPNSIVLDHGKIYTLRLINDAGGGHNFTAKTFFEAASVAPEARQMLKSGSIEVPAHSVRQLVFTAPAAAGSHKLKCTHTLHSSFGMNGTIVVR